ncbi:hypothetical protein KPH14_009888 [Odynerus spinipes]|uniref:Uncharacterized protein n=1 Tax=Odynerus spinipes TaxID=1348599 RepID=A0AAD9RER8_9HYME|nr:hypothetical protein KPH14_009888 [Odynerus spinipes]
MNIKAIGDFLSDFSGACDTLCVWEKQVRLLQTTYGLDDQLTKILMASKLKSNALNWLHSKPEHIEMSAEELLNDMKKVFDHRPSKLMLRKKFEDRKWIVGEHFSEYHHDKLILANQVGVRDDEEIVDHIIDGIADEHLRDQA